MRKLKIGVDADDFLVDFAGGFIDFCNKLHGYSLQREQVVTYDLWKVLGVKREESRKLVDGYYVHKSFMRMKPMPGAVVAMQELRGDGHDLSVITSRPDPLAKDVTIKQMRLIFPGIFSAIFFSWNDHAQRGNLTKREILDGGKFDVLGEDSPHYAEQCASPGRLIGLYTHKDSRWNHAPIENEEALGIFRFSEFPYFVKRVREYANNGETKIAKGNDPTGIRTQDPRLS